jgi:hypothetical protein
MFHTKPFNGSGLNSDGPYFSTTTPFLEFSIQFQSNNLIYDKGYSKRQHVIYSLIILLREEGIVQGVHPTATRDVLREVNRKATAPLSKLSIHFD